jgi:hypothetical protein
MFSVVFVCEICVVNSKYSELSIGRRWLSSRLRKAHYTGLSSTLCVILFISLGLCKDCGSCTREDGHTSYFPEWLKVTAGDRLERSERAPNTWERQRVGETT